MGIAHAFKKPTLLLLHSRDAKIPNDIPFDINMHRILTFGTVQALRSHLKNELPTIGGRKYFDSGVV
jgi:hypothetical protein